MLPQFGSRTQRLLSWTIPVTTLTLALTFATPSSAQVAPADRLCDNAFEDCRATILQMIRNETAGIDVSYWFMTDWRYSSEIIKRWQAGVPVRILLDLRADPGYPAGVSIRQSFTNAGIPIRHKVTTGINHWKMMLYRGQNAVHFSAANFANGSYSPSEAGGEYVKYVDEAIYFTTDPVVVQTFMKKYDDIWTNTTHYVNLANISGPLTRNYPTYSGNQLDPELNFPPDEDYQDRLIAQMKNETQQIDVAMFRITSGKVPDELLRRVQAGVPVRLITDRRQYRNTTYFWDSYNVDRMYLAGIPIKWKDSGTDQDMHQKSVVLHGVDMAIFGSSNWTASSSDTQREHNYFTRKTWFVDWLKEQFLRKWDNTRADGTASHPGAVHQLHAGLAGNTGERLAGKRCARRRCIGPPEVGRRLVGAQIRYLLRHDQPTAARRAEFHARLGDGWSSSPTKSRSIPAHRRRPSSLCAPQGSPRARRTTGRFVARP